MNEEDVIPVYGCYFIINYLKNSEDNENSNNEEDKKEYFFSAQNYFCTYSQTKQRQDIRIQTQFSNTKENLLLTIYSDFILLEPQITTLQFLDINKNELINFNYDKNDFLVYSMDPTSLIQRLSITKALIIN